MQQGRDAQNNDKRLKNIWSHFNPRITVTDINEEKQKVKEKHHLASTNWRQTNEDINSINWLIISLVAGKWKLDVFLPQFFKLFSKSMIKVIDNF